MNRKTSLTLLLLLGITVMAHTVLPAPGIADDAFPHARPRHVPPSVSPSKAIPTVPLRSPPAHAQGPEHAARAALDGLKPFEGRYALAVVDPSSGRTFTHGASTEAFASASIIKVDILAALLLQKQDRGTSLTEAQEQLASRMIRFSDNDAAQELWVCIGRRQGLDAANARLGLTAAHAGQRGPWGLTQTTVHDQLALLKAVFEDDSPLSTTSRAYLRSLMSDVTAGQDWGVGAAGSPTSVPVLKNGWLPRETTGLWVVNSIGIVEYAGRSMLVVVLTDGQPTREAGIALVERTATAAVHTLVDQV
ncbi:serine hydrolase [Streptomyces sp. NPDC058872]|uniref:serine hydrolase n=1 Tax=Streptomyces sp. NPDC058872 TaxID=3346661 RepID=UPI0036A53541